MKTNIFKSLLVILSLFVSCYALGEDFVTVYFHDGTHKKLFLNDVSQIKLSKTDLNNISHGDFQTQMIETSEGTYLQDLSQIDSVVFSREALNFPQTDEDLEVAIQRSQIISSKTNEIVDSLNKIGINDVVQYAKEFMSLPEVIDAEVIDNENIVILRIDSIYHDYILNKNMSHNGFGYGNQNYSMMNWSQKASRFIPKQEELHIKSNSDIINSGTIIKDIQKVLVLCPFESLYERDFVEDFCESLKKSLHVDPHLFYGDKADISKFKGGFLDTYDLIIFMTHGGRSSRGTTLVSASTVDRTWWEKTKQQMLDQDVTNDYWKHALETGVIPELRTAQVPDDDNVYIEMTPKFLDDASFDKTIVFSFACSSADRSFASPSMMSSFLSKGAAYYCGFSKDSKTTVVEQFGTKAAQLSFMGVSIQEAFDYFKNHETTKSVLNDWIEYAVVFFNFNKESDAFSLDLFDYDAKYSSCFLKDPYPFALMSEVDNTLASLSWSSNLSEDQIRFLIPDMEIEEYVERPIWNLYVRYDVFVNGTQIGSNLFDNQIQWNANMCGSHTWYVVAKVLNPSTGETVASYKSKEEQFTIEEQQQDTRDLMFAETIGGVKYAIYKEILNENDYHENPDGWKCYRSKLTLDITKNGHTDTYAVDNNIYLDKQVQHAGQTPCMMLDFNRDKMCLFINSKDDQPYYSMNGNFYMSSINNVSFKKEYVFEGANWGWYPYFRNYNDDRIYLCNFSFAGYFTILAVRETDGTWKLYYDNEDISPSDAQAEWERADKILVIGNP